jgi:hypothetical protein
MEIRKNAKRATFRFPSIARWSSGLLTSAAAILVSLHHWFPHLLAMIPVELQVAIAITVFAFLTDRILALHQVMARTTISIHPAREAAYDNLFELVKTFGASKIDLLQFSGASALKFLQSVAALGRNVEVRMFVVDNGQADKFDLDYGDRWHGQRINGTLEALWLASQDHPNFKFNAYRYSSNAEVSAIVIDDFYGSLGWYRSYVEEKNGAQILRIRGHNTVTINVINERSLLAFARSQIDHIQKIATDAVHTTKVGNLT